MPPLLTVAVPKAFGQRQLDADHPTPGGITQYIPTDPGPPPLEQYAPAVPVRVVSPTLLPYLCLCLSCCASNCRRCPTTTPPVTYLFRTMWQDLLEEIGAWCIPECQSPKTSQRISQVTTSTTLAHVSAIFARDGADLVL